MIRIDLRCTAASVLSLAAAATAQPNLRVIPPVTASPTIVSPGLRPFQLTVIAENNGNAATSPSFLEAYLSTDRLFSPGSDVLIGRVSIGRLQRNGRSVLLSGGIPFQTRPGAYFVLGVADAQGTSGDVNFADNVVASSGRITVRPLTCPTRPVLEFGNPQTYGNYFVEEISAARGASVPLEITAPCNVNDLYLVLASVTPFNGGFQLGSCRVPLTLDTALTTVLNLVNVAPFCAFSGATQVNNTALLKPTPRAFSPGNFNIYMATVFLRGNGCSAVTNPVTLTVLP